MSFLTITDPKKRRETVDRFLRAREGIERDFIQEKIGEADFQQSISQFTDPIKQIQQEQTQQLSDKLDTLQLTQTPAMSVPAIEAPGGPKVLSFGPLALESLSRVQQGLPYDSTFGIKWSETGQDFFLGDDKIEIIEDDIHLEDGTVYEGTPGLWDLINNPEPKQYDEEDLRQYRGLVLRTGLLYKKDGKPRSSRAFKWTDILSPIHKHYKTPSKPKRPQTGGSTVIIPSDPDALIDRLQLLQASKQAGNTGVRNEIVSICDELLRQGVISKSQYKRFFTR